MTTAHPPHFVRSSLLATLPWLRHAFSTRIGGTSTVYGQPGELNLGYTREDTRANVDANRRALIEKAAGPAWALTTARQIHSSITLPVNVASPSPEQAADGLTTTQPGLLLAMLTADCVPVLVADPVRRTVAVFHAGWRGTVEQIVERGIRTMQDHFSSEPSTLLAAIGPSIGLCCYQTGDEVHTRFHDRFPYAAQLFQNAHLDLWQANRRQLLRAGLRSENIDLLAQCTACTFTDGRRHFFSHRAEHGVTGRMMALIGIAPEPPGSRQPPVT